MRHRGTSVNEAVQNEALRANTLCSPFRYIRFGFTYLSIAAAVFFSSGDVAQAQGANMSFRARDAATGTKNPEAGEYPLDSVPDILVSVPKQCTGEHRCPMLVVLPGAGYGSRQMTDWFRPVADKYGILVFASSEEAYQEPAILGKALKDALRKFAVDPNKIGIMGRCASGGAGMRYGIDNLDIFNRIISVSGGVPVQGVDPKNKTAEFFIDRGFLEAGANFRAVRELHEGGHPAKLVIALRGHEHQMEDYDFLGHWLQESWAKPNPADRTKPAVIADPLPELTSDVLTKMTDFWTSFGQEPDSIRATARRATLHEVVIPVAEERASLWMTDMTTLAARYPSVAADLKKAGLTPQQHDAYRVALISAQATQVAGDRAGKVDSASVLGKNVDFVNAHMDLFKTLRAAGIAHPDQVMQVQQSATIVHPQLADKMGAMGIWRTP